MSYEELSHSTIEPPFSQEQRPDHQSLRQVDPMDIHSCWIEKIDPLLRQAQIGSPDFDYQQDLPKQPLQRFITEPTRNLFTTGPTMTHFERFSRTLPRFFEPIEIFPQAGKTRMISPDPSHELSSTCSSTRSPDAESEWFHDGYYSSQGQDEYPLPNTQTTSSPNFSNIWSQSHTQPLQSAGYPCVNLSDVQGFADPQEIKFEPDETYIDMDNHAEYAIHVSDSRGQKSTPHILNYRDEALGDSVGDAASPLQTTSMKLPKENNVSRTSGPHADIDAEGEVDDDIEDADNSNTNADEDIEIEIDPGLHTTDDIEEELSDTEYTPRPSNRNPRKRSHPNKSISPPNTKRSRISKTSSTSTSTSKTSKIPNNPSFTCKQCSTTGFKDNPALQRHIASSHTRAFICVLDFAGCNSTFASKNEWKRHVSSQHLNLQAWVCTLGSCGKVPLSSHSSAMKSSRKDELANEKIDKAALQRGYEVKGAEFNRKDLFTQHLRRMHAPFEVKRKGKRSSEWEERVKGLQRSCERVRREPPVRLRCPAAGCGGAQGVMFEGSGCWDERMEHLGRHLEKMGEKEGIGCAGQSFPLEVHASTAATQVDQHINQEEDKLFVEWAAREKIIERGSRGEWVLCAGAGGNGRGWARKKGAGLSLGVRIKAEGEGETVGMGEEEGEEDAEGEDE